MSVPLDAFGGAATVVRQPCDLGFDLAWFSRPEPIDFPTSGGRTAHAIFYPPTNPDVAQPNDELPPLLVVVHGGPTGAAPPVLQLGIQYWTSRGFAVVDVNYGGSTGYGRSYRRQLDARWGVVDVDDCVAAACWLAACRRVDSDRLCIRGGSAGGYTTLAALAFRDTFVAGASHYGIADLEAMAIETHKFESHYLDGLVGVYPDRRDVYVERSPIHHVERFDRPLIVLQGLEDEVVPPNQAEMIVGAVRAKGVPVAYVTFEGEQHGFRQAANIRRALDSELSFYAQIFGFAVPRKQTASNQSASPISNPNCSPTGSSGQLRRNGQASPNTAQNDHYDTKRASQIGMDGPMSSSYPGGPNGDQERTCDDRCLVRGNAPRLTRRARLCRVTARHDDRLWFAHWGAGEVVAVDLDGHSEVVAAGPDGLGWSIDWLGDGRLLITGPELMRREPAIPN